MEEWEGEVGKGEGDAFGAGGDNIDSVTAVVGEGGAKIVGAVPVGVPRKTVVGAVKRKTKLAGGMKGMGGEVIRKTVKTRPGREGRVGTQRSHDVEGERVRRGVKAVPKVRWEVGMGGGEGRDKVVLACPH